MIRRRKKDLVTAPVIHEEELMRLHIRLCHNCFYLNEGLNEIGQCRRCKKHLTFDSYVEDLSTEQLADLWVDQDHDEDQGKPQHYYEEDEFTDDNDQEVESQEPRIAGLSVLW